MIGNESILAVAYGSPGSPTDVLTALDVLNRRAWSLAGSIYVLIAVLCKWVSGTVSPADDVSAATWVEMATISSWSRDQRESVSTVTAMAGRWGPEE